MKHSEKWLLAVTAGRWQLHGIREARKAGLSVLAIDADSEADGLREADASLTMHLGDSEAVIRAIRAMQLRICGAVSFASEAGMSLTARLREEFNLPGPRSEIYQRVTDKALQRELWTRHGVPGPKWQVFQNAEKAFAAVSQGEFPVIIKPTDSSGSRGVTKIESMADDIRLAINQAFSCSRTAQIIIESYMDGIEFTVEAFAINYKVHVLAVTEKKKIANTRATVAYELATPDRTPEVINSIQKAVISAFEALEYKDGPGHAEVILMKDGFVGLVEVAGRGGGFMVFDKLIPAVSGINIARFTALQAAGIPVEMPEIEQRAAILKFFPSVPGILKGIAGFEQANLIQGIEAAPFVAVGTRLEMASTDGNRMGFMLSKAATIGAARAALEQAEQQIHFDIEVQP